MTPSGLPNSLKAMSAETVRSGSALTRTETPRLRRHTPSRTREVPRLALTPEEAAEALGMGVQTFRDHVDAELRWTRLGRKRIVSVREIERYLEQTAERLPC